MKFYGINFIIILFALFFLFRARVHDLESMLRAVMEMEKETGLSS